MEIAARGSRTFLWRPSPLIVLHFFWRATAATVGPSWRLPPWRAAWIVLLGGGKPQRPAGVHPLEPSQSAFQPLRAHYQLRHQEPELTETRGPLRRTHFLMGIRSWPFVGQYDRRTLVPFIRVAQRLIARWGTPRRLTPSPPLATATPEDPDR